MSVDAAIRKVREDIERVGWSAMGVGPTAQDPETTPFMYSIGFSTTFEHPEVIVFGLPYAVAYGMLERLASVLEQGERFELDVPTAGILAGDYLVKFSVMAERRHRDFLKWALNHYGGSLPFGAWVMLWPDKDGAFPGPGDDGSQAEALEVLA